MVKEVKKTSNKKTKASANNSSKKTNTKEKKLEKELSKAKLETQNMKKEVNLWMISAFILGGLFIISLFTSGFNFTNNYEKSLTIIDEELNKIQDEELMNQLNKIKSELEDFYNNMKENENPTLTNDDNFSDNTNTNLEAKYDDSQVEMDMYVMSLCPYGIQAEDGAIPAIKKLDGQAKLNIHFIGNYQGDSFSALHGQPEVEENMRQLCVRENTDLDTFYDYILCYNQNRDANTCYNELGIDSNLIETCVDSEEGKNLLRESYDISSSAGATGSPTITYGNNQRYQSNDRSENAFLRLFCNELDTKPEICDNIPECSSNDDCQDSDGMIGVCSNPGTQDAKCELIEDASVELTVVNSNECPSSICDTNYFIQLFTELFPNIEVTQLDISSQEGQVALEKSGLDKLPAYIFSENLENTARYQNYANAFTKTETGYSVISQAVGSVYDPTLEEIPNKADVFIMGECPYGLNQIKTLPEVMNALPEIDLNVHFIATYDEATDSFNSLHGQSEVEENKLMICVIENYPEESINFLVQRANNLEANWETQAPDLGIDATVIQDCLDNDAVDLLKEDIKKANDLGISGSPTWVINNVFPVSGYLDAEGTKQLICSFNDLEGCDDVLSTDETVASGANC